MKRTILIIDDDDGIKEPFEFLFDARYAVVWARCGNEGLRYFEAATVDLVILDMVLPDISGVEVLKRIRSRSDAPVIVISGFSDKRNVLDCWKEGATRYLEKPFNFLEIESLVTLFLGIAGKRPVPARDETPQTQTREMFKRIEQATAFVIENLPRKTKLREAAAVASMHPSSFSQQFRRIRGLSFQDFLAQSRCEHAKKMLRETSKSIKEIAFDMGYNDPLSFSKSFKELTGSSPLRFRRAR